MKRPIAHPIYPRVDGVTSAGLSGTAEDTFARMRAALRGQPSFADPTRRPLGQLNIDALDDAALALLDAWATVCGVLDFYQERIRGEGYLAHAREERSIHELAATVGLSATPPLGARTDLSLTVSASKSAPEVVVVPRGAAVQSVPAGEGSPQVFETMEDLEAREAWNAMALRRAPEPLPALDGDATALLVRGAAPTVKVGDVLLLTGTVGGAPFSATRAA
jgi:hypothetical protein